MRQTTDFWKRCFSKNIMVHFLTRSKQAVELLATGGPYGAYSIMTNWLRHQADNHLLAPKGDLITFFDNTQVVGNTHHITLSDKTPSFTITTSIHVTASGPELQQQEELSPANWLTNFQMTGMQQRHLKTLQLKCCWGRCHYSEWHIWQFCDSNIQNVTFQNGNVLMHI